jgi:hypothetical protein
VIFAHLTQAASNLPTDASALESSISALESEIKAWEISSVPWEHSVWVFTFLVMVGVAMELWVIRHERNEEIEAWALAHFGIFWSEVRPSTAKLSVEVVSVLLITMGIAGKLGIGIKIASINGVLRGKSAELRIKSDQLIALINDHAGAANERAANLELENMRLETIIQPRNLKPKQQQELIAVCGKFHGHGAEISSYGMDAEALGISSQIIAALRAAQIAVADNRASEITTGSFETGIHVRTKFSSELPFASCIAKVLQNDDLETKLNDPEPLFRGAAIGGGGQAFTGNPPHIKIFVGIKPLPLLTDKQSAKPNK